MNKKQQTEFREILQSSNINFLIGSGASQPFLPTLLNLEKEINNAIQDSNTEKQVEGYKKYFKEVMLPSRQILSEDKKDNSKLQETTQSYQLFFETLSNIILNRKTTVLSKQINIFTTNIDVFMESTLEGLHIDYNDGFSGKLKPVFSLSNFKKSIFQRSLHFDHKSEIPIFNIFKLHGSLNWRYGKNNEDIYLEPKLEHIDDSLLEKNGEDFIEEYKNNILVVNPENQKFSETVLNTYYYELLRVYSSELEKENSVLFVIGFSMEDQHIKKITQRVAKSNPTLKIFIFLHSKTKKINQVDISNKELMEEKIASSQFRNIEILSPESDDKKYNLNTIIDTFFKTIIFKEEENKPISFL